MPSINYRPSIIGESDAEIKAKRLSDDRMNKQVLSEATELRTRVLNAKGCSQRFMCEVDDDKAIRVSRLTTREDGEDSETSMKLRIRAEEN